MFEHIDIKPFGSCFRGDGAPATHTISLTDGAEIWVCWQCFDEWAADALMSISVNAWLLSDELDKAN